VSLICIRGTNAGDPDQASDGKFTAILLRCEKPRGKDRRSIPEEEQFLIGAW